MKVKIGQNKGTAEISDKLYHYIAENFCGQNQQLYINSLEKGYITFSQLRDYGRAIGVPYCLFFGNYNQVRSQVAEQNKKLFGALDGKVIIGTRGNNIDIRVIRFIILDILGKQSLFKRFGNRKRLDDIVKFLSSSPESITTQANYVVRKLGIDRNHFWSISTKREALKYLRQKLSENNIHVAIEARNYMPQNIPESLRLSGVYVRDNFNPYIFICNELSGEPTEGSGRKIYTLIFLLVCIFKGKSRAISINKNSYSVDNKKDTSLQEIYEITNEILMPEEEMGKLEVTDFDSIKNFAEKFNVTPRALIERLHNVGYIKNEYEEFKQLASDTFQKARSDFKIKNLNSSGPGKKIMIAYYQGDFIDFIRTKLPENQRPFAFEKHVRYKRIAIAIDQL